MREPRAGALIQVDKFIKATRDSGYKGTGNAIAEIVDNALQAGARSIRISVDDTGEGRFPLRVMILDDGQGMDAHALRRALSFGGSSRFNDRRGIGRYGMGLPNSSLSQARRLDVYTWQAPGDFIGTYIDVDEIAAGAQASVPPPTPAEPPQRAALTSDTGTLIVWSRCDRLDNRRISTICRKLAASLGRIFRHYLWGGVELSVNGAAVVAFDPLFLSADASHAGAARFGDPLVYEVQTPANSDLPPAVGLVTVTFTELPVHEWHSLSNKEKRQMGVAKRAGVSVVRAKREVDYGWFFMGGKRRENYDDWWRCEVRFDPVLDEAFGITHTKQQIRPMSYLTQILTPDLEVIARLLNRKARGAHANLKVRALTSAAESLATTRGERLAPLPAAPTRGGALQRIERLAARDKTLARAPAPPKPGAVEYRIARDKPKGVAFFDVVYQDGRVVVILNEEHPFYKRVYAPLLDGEDAQSKLLRSQLELMMMAAARSEAAIIADGAAAELLEAHRRHWGEALATFLDG